MYKWLTTEWDFAGWSDSTTESVIMGTPDECIGIRLYHARRRQGKFLEKGKNGFHLGVYGRRLDVLHQGFDEAPIDPKMKPVCPGYHNVTH